MFAVSIRGKISNSVKNAVILLSDYAGQTDVNIYHFETDRNPFHTKVDISVTGLEHNCKLFIMKITDTFGEKNLEIRLSRM